MRLLRTPLLLCTCLSAIVNVSSAITNFEALIGHPVGHSADQAATEAGREVRIVTDILADGNSVETDGVDNVYPAHTWLLFCPWKGQGALRVELASPIIEGRARSLVVAVTEYDRAPDEMGLPDSTLPLHTYRKLSTLDRTIDLTNEQIFSPGLLSAEGGNRPPSAVADSWVMRAIAMSRPADNPREDRGYSSHQFAFHVLGTPPLDYTGIDLYMATRSALIHPRAWADIKRGKLAARDWQAALAGTFSPGRPPPTPINHLVWRAPVPSRAHSPYPWLMRGRKVSAVFTLDPSNPEAPPRRVPADWRTLMPTGWKPLNGTLVDPVLSTDPLLTSDVLSLDADGAFIGWDPDREIGRVAIDSGSESGSDGESVNGSDGESVASGGGGSAGSDGSGRATSGIPVVAQPLPSVRRPPIPPQSAPPSPPSQPSRSWRFLCFFGGCTQPNVNPKA